MAKQTLFAVFLSILDDLCAYSVRAAWVVCLLIIDFQNLNNIFENTVNISIRKAFYKTEQLIDLIVHVFTLAF